MKWDAFISYRRDGGYLMAQMLCGRLAEKGLRCYLDVEESHPGQFDESILEAIANASNFILVLTQGTLDRCVNEYDWVRREYLAAVENKKNIIPVRYHDFAWPTELSSLFPDKLRALENTQGVLFTREYPSAAIERIIEYMGCTGAEVAQKARRDVAKETERFFLNGMDQTGAEGRVDMAFHAGTEWRRESYKVEILTRIIEEGFRLRVLVNDERTVSTVCRHMKQPLKRYIGFDGAIREWVELAREYPEQISVRVADVPLLHRLYLIRNEQAGMVNVKYYTYANGILEKDFRHTFGKEEPEFELYAREFDYLWEKVSHDPLQNEELR